METDRAEYAGSADDIRVGGKFSVGRNQECSALIAEIRDFIQDVNVNEIADHFDDDRLQNWCGAWKEAVTERVDRLEELYDKVIWVEEKPDIEQDGWKTWDDCSWAEPKEE